eukprot:TRINITY_DN6525_c0_g1_i1.p1 TRINITY_DN6525_c0_g1~~TRINITY_DN6525_c0_g1_i1.p1  ORF type:complete len:256 (-),score=25.74 TRINITY_DN6525_c0_g1_i1:251-1018(-)
MNTSPLIYTLIETPLTAASIGVCVGFFLYILHYRLPPESICFSYEKVLVQKEAWRIFTSSFGHFTLPHLLLNMLSLWSCRYLEIMYGSIVFLKYCFLLLVLSMVTIIVVYHALIFMFRKENYFSSLSVGYSCVVFGLMTIQACLQNQVVLAGFSIPPFLFPFVPLVLTSLIVPNASFIGHLSGIIVGLGIAFGYFDWFNNYLFFGTLSWVFIFLIYNIKVTTSLRMPFLQFDEGSLGRTWITNGTITRERPGMGV